MSEIKVSEEQVALAEKLSQAGSDMAGVAGTLNEALTPAEIEFQTAFDSVSRLISDYKQMIFRDAIQMGAKLTGILQQDQ